MVSSQLQLHCLRCTESINLPPREALDEFVMDLRPCIIEFCFIFFIKLDMDRSHLVIHSTWGYMEAYNVFKVLGVRHIPVVDEHSQVIGILTRHDLLSYYTREN